MYGSLYGTLPLVHRVGGLADTVTDCTLENLAENTATGFSFGQFDVSAFESAVLRAFTLFGKPAKWRKVQKRGMQQSFSWRYSAEQYISLYRQIKIR